MKRSNSRILTSHAGSLYLPPSEAGEPAPLLTHPSAAAARPRDEVARAVQSVVRKQVEVGIDIINNGDLSTGMQLLDPSRLLGGVEPVPVSEKYPFPRGCPDHDMEVYHEYYEHFPFAPVIPEFTFACTGPLTSNGLNAVQWDVATLKKATEGQPAEGVFLDFLSPGWMTRVLFNDFYPTEEKFIFALAEAMKPYYQAAADAGLILQIDSPDIVDNWSWERWDDVKAYRKHLQMRVDALNGALAGCPQDQIRLHFCWGSWQGPHSVALPLEEIIDIVYTIRAECISLEAAKPNHTHEWRVFKDHPLPAGKSLMPGVIDHTTPVIEHPQVIADRIVAYAKVVGKENVIAGTDCGMRIDARVEWDKLKAMVNGAALASAELFG